MPSKNRPTIQQRMALLSTLPCSVPGCDNNRTGAHLYCSRHHHSEFLYGHPHGRSILRSEYSKEAKEVRSLFETSQDHPGLVSVLRWLNEWMAHASAGEAPCGNEMFKHLHDKRMPALDILTEICAVWLFSQRNPHLLPDDQRLTFALARNPVRLAVFEQTTWSSGRKATKQLRTTEVRESGQRIRRTLALFLLNVAESIRRREEQAQDFRSSLSIPFN